MQSYQLETFQAQPTPFPSGSRSFNNIPEPDFFANLKVEGVAETHDLLDANEDSSHRTVGDYIKWAYTCLDSDSGSNPLQLLLEPYHGIALDDLPPSLEPYDGTALGHQANLDPTLASGYQPLAQPQTNFTEFQGIVPQFATTDASPVSGGLFYGNVDPTSSSSYQPFAQPQTNFNAFQGIVPQFATPNASPVSRGLFYGNVDPTVPQPVATRVVRHSTSSSPVTSSSSPETVQHLPQTNGVPSQTYYLEQPRYEIQSQGARGPHTPQLPFQLPSEGAQDRTPVDPAIPCPFYENFMAEQALEEILAL
ncbi:hypothetical protein FQN57_005055 [Myotisia sp. PD_48]|nr:hypothetical protein FQN57_005055 [Myotisia sp. PD_48]